MAVDQGIGQGMRRFLFGQCFQLDEQAFAQVASADAYRFQCLKLAQYIFDAFYWRLQVVRDFLRADIQVSAIIEVAHELFSDERIFGRDEGIKLLQEGIGQRLIYRNTRQRVKLVVVVVFVEAVIVNIIGVVFAPLLLGGLVILMRFARTTAGLGGLPEMPKICAKWTL